MNPTTPFLPLVVLCLAVVLAGCGTRGPNSDIVPTPYDPSKFVWEREFDQRREELMRPQPASAYHIGPGDVLTLALIGREDIFGPDDDDEPGFNVTVTEDPFILLPYIGKIRVHGKTAEQLQGEIGEAYTAVGIREPIPVVTVEKYFYNQVAVIGSVQSPGKYPLEPGDTVVELVFRAGGLTLGGRGGGLPPARILKVYRAKTDQKDRADLTIDELIDMLRDREGRIQPRDEIILPLDEFLIGGRLDYNIPLRPNDIIYIPPAGTVTMHGDFTNPRVVFLGPGLRSLAQVNTEVGGLRWRSASRVEIVRQNADGSQESFFINLREIMDRKEADFILQDGDQVFAYTHPVRGFFDTLGSIFKTTFATGVNATYTPI